MRVCMICCLILAVGVPMSCGQTPSKEEIPDLLQPFGRIYLLDEETRVGAAFVGGETFNIFTPAHVAVADTLYFKPFGSKYSFRISLKYLLKDFDLAVYERTGGHQPAAYKLGDIKRIQPGDKIKYIGWDSDNYANFHDATVTAKGTTIHYREIVEFIDFQGHGVPGYSGGPVLNERNEVIAMIVQGWDFSPINSDATIRVLRAYSIDLLRILEQKLGVTTTSDSVGSGKLRLMEILRD